MKPPDDRKYPRYPDISDILAQKLAGRKDIAQRSFGEKIEMMEALRTRLQPFKKLREARSDKVR